MHTMKAHIGCHCHSYMLTTTIYWLQKLIPTIKANKGKEANDAQLVIMAHSHVMKAKFNIIIPIIMHAMMAQFNIMVVK